MPVRHRPDLSPAAFGLGLLLACGSSWAGDAVASAATPVDASVAPDKEGWDKMMEGILSKEGISMSGVFRSQYLHSSIGGAGALSNRRSEESLEFTSVDFDVRARPNTATQGRLVFRMHQDWRNFFSDIGNPISSRWISIDGRGKDIFRYNIGDFRQRYSALTLHSPDIGLLYEPEVFAAQRQDATNEVFLGNNDRILQGVNLNLDAGVEGASGAVFLKEIHLNVLGSRLRNVETSIQNGGKPVSFTERSPVEKFVAAGNADAVLPAGLSLGGSHLRIFDKKGSYAGPGDADTAAQRTSIWAGRGGFDLASAMGWSKAALSLSGEYVISSDDSASFVSDTSEVTETRSIDGSALLGRLQGAWSMGKSFGFKVGVDYHRNEPQYRNEMAQSPSFVGERILNIENDNSPVRTNDARALNYSTFDAMYRHVFKFAPSEQTNLWSKAPFSKNSYKNSILTQSELASFEALRLDTALQLVMPFGPATPNRAGIRSNVIFTAWEDRVEVQGMLTMMDQIEGRRIDSARVMPKTAYSQAGGGLKLDIGSMFGLAYPLTLSGSLVRSTAENAGLADSLFAASKVESDFANAGIRYKFWKRASILAGYQQIRTKAARNLVDTERTQTNVAGGLEYKVAEGAFATLSMNRISFDPGAGAADKEFSQLQTDLFLTVRF